MPKQMPDLAGRFSTTVEETLKIVSSSEVLWLTAPPTSAVRQHLKVDRLEALYESAFLRIFSTWENFLEEAVARYIAGYACPLYRPVPVPGATIARTIKEARARLYGGRRFLLWHDPARVADRSGKHLSQCPVEMVTRANRILLDDIASIRHHIAHAGSQDSRIQFRSAAQRIAGGTYKDSPGRLLRSPDVSDPLNQPKWIRVIADEFVGLAQQIVG